MRTRCLVWRPPLWIGTSTGYLFSIPPYSCWFIRYEGKNIQILTPKNCQTVQLKFRGEKTAKVRGRWIWPGPLTLFVMMTLCAGAWQTRGRGCCPGKGCLGHCCPKGFQLPHHGSIGCAHLCPIGYHTNRPKAGESYCYSSPSKHCWRYLQILPYHQPFDLLRECLAQMFESVSMNTIENKDIIQVKFQSSIHAKLKLGLKYPLIRFTVP